LVESLYGWINTVAGKFANGYLQREDFIQEGTVALLTAQVQEEGLAKCVVLRAMTKYRKRHDLVRVSGNGRCPLKRSQYDDLMKVQVTDEQAGVFWENVERAMPAVDSQALRWWLDSDSSMDQIGREKGVSGRTIRKRVERALGVLRDRAGVEPGEPTTRRQPKRTGEE
jgi:hypothetical protein